MNERKIDTLKAAIRTTIEESNCIYGDIIKALGQLEREYGEKGCHFLNASHIKDVIQKRPAENTSK